jgi:hypothetical protein
LLANFEAQGKSIDLSSALYCLFVPIAELRDARGHRSYAAFQLKLSLIQRLDLRYAFDIKAPMTERLVAVVRRRLKGIDDADFQLRMQLASGLFWQTLAMLDAPEDLRPTRRPESSIIPEALKMVEAILKQSS